ncbi:flagellar biosynthesis protein FlhF [Jeotgalibacillus sp. ET6]|uniref:flagellar biosynthesis protein FlhF n=1 Tax=Jeotgalibacillus sp. ET6 TaxID=3037260 RepID=UPI0024187A1C|nr:flagellar biosynthesis protein FlhF [Jeotgalibacillus sp. ET6]MDG5470307.1 flagellar biosynthesis protein FlhF [Jeotgalibacillus sp. ET6]
MKVKKIMADSMQEAMKKVRSEFGDDAVILNSKAVYTGGFLGLFKKKRIEVTAGTDDLTEPPALLPAMNHLKESEENYKADFNEIKEILSRFQPQTQTAFHHFPPVIQEELKRYKELDFDEHWLLELGQFVFEKWKEDGKAEDVHSHSLAFFKKKMKGLVHKGIDTDRKFINVVGPTGVGKTTTIAKMAAKLVVEQKRKIAFITTDTYRIGAIEQLKTYAQLLNVPIEVVYNRSDFEQAVVKFEQFDHIFIDTAGRNYREKHYVEDLKNVLNFSVNMQSFLVLSMTARRKDMQAVIEQFKDVDISHFIFTKQDESTAPGAVIQIMTQNKKGAAFITTGQAVPEDIKEASTEHFLNLLEESGKH